MRADFLQQQVPKREEPIGEGLRLVQEALVWTRRLGELLQLGLAHLYELLERARPMCRLRAPNDHDERVRSTGMIFWYRSCSVCGGQGRLFIFKDLSRNELYLHCEECECGWRDPATAHLAKAAFLTLDEAFDSVAATREDIETFGWQQYAKNIDDR